MRSHSIRAESTPVRGLGVTPSVPQGREPGACPAHRPSTTAATGNTRELPKHPSMKTSQASVSGAVSKQCGLAIVE